jgi:predicted anti-sigma-YlaC factor YlaD
MKFKRGDRVRVIASVDELTKVGIPEQQAKRMKKMKFLTIVLKPSGTEGRVWVVTDFLNLSLKEEFLEKYENNRLTKLVLIIWILSILLLTSIGLLSYYVSEGMKIISK